MSNSNGYENIAWDYIKTRGNGRNNIGVPVVKKWAKALPLSGHVLDVGCCNGIPITKTLLRMGLSVCGIDASKTMVEHFRQNFYDVPIKCESVENSTFFDRQFDGILAWGLLFLLSPENQIALISKISQHLYPGGKFLFTSPKQKCTWQDLMTGQISESLGKEYYEKLLIENGLGLIGHHVDKGGNFYYSCIKTENKED